MKIDAYGKIYTSGDVKVNLLNLQPDGIDGIMYGEKQDMDPIYTMGSREPMAMMEKEVKYESSLTVKAIVLDALEKAAPGGKIQRIKPFEIGVSYMDDAQQVIKHDNLGHIRFKGAKREVKNDNNELVYELELFIGGIQRNV